MAIAVNKNNILNFSIIIIALIFANNIYKKQTVIVGSLKQKRNIELKKNEVLSDISQLEKMLNSYKALFYKDRSLVINPINNLAKESGVRIISIRPTPEVNFQMYSKYPIDLVISADDYHSVGKFISMLESFSYVYIVDDVDIEPAAGSLKEDQEYKLSVNLKLGAILLKD